MSQRTSPLLLAAIPGVAGFCSCSVSYAVVGISVKHGRAGSLSSYLYFIIPLLIGAIATVATYLAIKRAPVAERPTRRLFPGEYEAYQEDVTHRAQVAERYARRLFPGESAAYQSEVAQRVVVERRSSRISPWAVFGSVIGVSAAAGAFFGMIMMAANANERDSVSHQFQAMAGGMVSSALIGVVFGLPVAILAALAIAIIGSRQSR